MSDLLDRLRQADQNSQQRIAGSRIFKEAADAIERLRHRNAALVEIVRDSPCPSDGRATVAECQQCGCSHGLMIKPLAVEQT